MAWLPHHRDRELDKELRFHLESLIAQNVAAGMSPEEARRQALLEFGGPAQIREECREIRALHWLAVLWSDVRYGLRTLRASKSFAAAAVLSLALGIGANTAIFTLLHAALWKPLPVPRPGELYHVMRRDAERDRYACSWVLFQQLRQTLAPYGDLLARGSAGPRKFALGSAQQQEHVVGEAVSGGYFQTLGVIPAAGRLFDPAGDDSPAPEPVLVLSHDFWARRFGADPAVIGREVQYEERPFRIIGVAQPGFHGVDAGAATDIFAPVVAINRNMIEGGAHTYWLDLLARLRPGVVPAQVQAELQARFRRHVAEDLRDASGRFAAILKAQYLFLRHAPSGFANDGRQFERPLVVLMAVVALVLLISCANVANLLLARNVARAREIAVRIALGAGRARLACQLLTESLLISLAGAVLGVAFGIAGCRLLIGLLPPSRVPLAFELSPDGTVLAFTAVLGVITALLCGTVPVWRASRTGTAGIRDEGLRVTARNFAGRALVAGQLALSLVLLGGAGLFLKTLHNLAAIDLGFRPERVVSFEFSYPRTMPDARRRAISRELLERLRARNGLLPTFAWPGVYADGGWSNGVRALDGSAPPAGDNEVQAFSVGPEFFETLGMHLVAGRGVERRDDAAGAPIAVVNETFARKYFLARPATGHRVTMAGKHEPPREIVGIIADVKHMGVRTSTWPAVYFPALQRDGLEGSLLVRSSVTPRALSEIVRAELQTVAPMVQIEQMTTLNRMVGTMISREVLVAVLSAAFGALAAFLAAMGLYGVMAYNMSRRTAEIGVRMALGAAPADIRRLALGESLRLAGIGLAIGVPAALAAGRFVRSLLFGMDAADPWVLSAAAGLMIAVAFVAAWLPAGRAARTDPNTALHRS